MAARFIVSHPHGVKGGTPLFLDQPIVFTHMDTQMLL